MRYAVRYYSRSGHTKDVAEDLANTLGVKAASVDAVDSAIDEPVDVLFVGGALYAYGLDQHLSDWIASLDSSKVGRARIFSTSWLSKHAIDLIRKGLEERGISVDEDYLYLKSGAVARSGEQIRAFAQKAIS